MKKPFGFIASLCLAGAVVYAGPALAVQANPAPTPAPAPAASLTTGTNVHDSAGEVVGKIAQVEGGKVAVAVGDRGIVVPANAFVQTPKGPALNVTKAKLLASVAQAARENDAAVGAALKVGADVRSAGGSAVLGQVKAVAADSALLTTGAGDVTVPRSVLFVSNAGLATTLSAQQFATAVAQSKAAAAPSN
ncbi:hypothetical protein [Sphingopyxis sp.]|uniref:hypothetical protein n=1 Tax=Sphingopyxis sp. TaxID=1908224 RepID=UPI001D1D4754|nr:hypothetical protein [Sphingopyxis sp.]MBW8296010.1 hypothetical protein [Sphingopyxis sp.]